MSATQNLVAVLTFASVGAMSAAQPALAQSNNWTGFYLGLNAGAVWSDGDLRLSATCPASVGPQVGYFCESTTPASLANAAAVGAAGTGSGSGTGFTGGVQAGYNLQAGAIVFGGEIDFGAFNFGASQAGGRNYPVGFFPVGTANTFAVGTAADASWLFTARGRLGFLATPNLLLFVTGGLAVSDITVSNSFSDNFASGGFAGARGSSSNSGVRAGWVLGAGGELALDRNWTLKAEYLYVDLGSIDTTARITHGNFAGYSNTLTTKADINAQIARVGVNYKF